MKTITLYLMLLLGSWSIMMAQSPIIGTWKGSYGNGSSQTGNFYSLQFNADGTMKVLYPDGNTICSGKHTITNNTVTGTYYYNGNQPYSFIGTYNPANNTITGTGGTGTATSGGFSWIMTSKSGGTASVAAAVPFGKKGTYTKAETVNPQTSPTQTMVVKNAPVATGMVIAGTVNTFSNPSYTRTLPDGIKVTTTMTVNPGSVNSNYGGTVQVTPMGTRNETQPDGQICVVETKKITATSDNYLSTDYANQSAAVYPGAIFTFEDFMSGNRREITAGRNPIRIGTSKTSGVQGAVTYREVPNPNRDMVNSAISSLRNTFSSAGSSPTWRIYTSNSESELGIKAAAAGGFAGFSASGSYSNQSREGYYILTIEAIKTFFSISTDLPANGYFADKSQEQNNRNLMVIQNVVYGCRILANVIIKRSARQEDLNFAAKYQAAGINASVDFNYFKNNNNVEQTVNVYIVGGPEDATVLNASNLQQGIEDLLSRANQSHAEPVAYRFTDISGNLIGIQSATDVFTTRTCLPKSSVYKLVNVSVDVATGTNDPKNSGSNVYFQLFNSKNILTATSSGSNNVEFPVGSYKSFNLNTTAMDVSKYPVSLPVNKDEALDLKNFTSGYLEIMFNPVQIALGWDEWQITGATVNLLFQDQNGANLGPFMLKYDNQNIYLKKDKPALRLPFTSNGVTFTAGGAYQQ